LVGQRIRLLRKINFKTQSGTAEALNIATTTVSSYENNVNEPSLDMLIKIANYFNVSVDYLLGRIDSLTEPEVKTHLNYSPDLLEKLDELHEIMLTIEDKEMRNLIVQSAIIYANGLKSTIRKPE